VSAHFCPDCLEVEVSPTARDGRCAWCRPVRRHSRPRRLAALRAEADKNFERLLDQHASQ
jgi:hypothetical protein